MADDDDLSATPKAQSESADIENHQSRDNVVEGLFSSVKYLQSALVETGFIK